MPGIGNININLEGQALNNQLYLIYVFRPCCANKAVIKLKPSSTNLPSGAVYVFDEDSNYTGPEIGLVSTKCYTLTHEFISDQDVYNSLATTPYQQNSILYWASPGDEEGCQSLKCQICDDYPNLGTFTIQSCCDENYQETFHIYEYPLEDFPLTPGTIFEYTGDVISQGCYQIVRDAGVYITAVYPFLEVEDFLVQTGCESTVCQSYCPQETCYDFTNCYTQETFIGTLTNPQEYTGSGSYEINIPSSPEPLNASTNCWTIEERNSCTNALCAYVYYKYSNSPQPIEFNGELLLTEYTYNDQPVYFIQNDAFPITLYIIYTGSVWQVWSGFDLITGPFCEPITPASCCEETPGVFIPYFESSVILNNSWENLCVPVNSPLDNPNESQFIFETYNCGATDEITEVTIIETYESCNECLKNCYKLTDCLTGEVLYYQGIYLSAYIGKVIKFDRVFPDGYTRLSCFLVEEDECLSDLIEFPFEVLDCFTECEDCLPKCICSSVVNSGTVSKRLAYTDCEGNRTFTAEFVPAGKRSKKYCVLSWDDADAFDELQFGNCEDGQCPVTPQPKKFVAPGYDTPVCTPEQYEKILCNHSEQAYKQVLADRYGISNCCPEDEIKWEIKYELIKLEALIDPDYTCQNLSDCGCGYISSDIHTYTCPTPEPEL